MAFKVLLVEDDNNLREIYEARLQAEGYNIVTARDGEEALGVAKAEVPDLVISDVMMPRVSGFEMLDILRNTDSLKSVKVIMLTALGQADDKTRANSLGADRYLVKSQVTLEDIVKTAHELLGDGASDAPAPAPSVSPAASNPVAAPAPVAPVTPPPMSSPAAAPAVVPAPPVVTPPSMPPVASPTMGVTQPPVVPAPAASAPIVPAPSLPPLPNAAPVVTPIAAPMPTPAPVAPAAPTTSEEQATVDTQINNFVQTAPDTTPAAEPGSSTAQDDAVLADAMHDLAASTKPDAEDSGTLAAAPQPPVMVAPAPAAPTPGMPPLPVSPAPVSPSAAPEPPATPADKPGLTNSVLIANKKIIQPLSGPEVKPDIHELAAREEANNPAGPGMMPPATTFSPGVATPSVPPAGPVVGGPGVTPPAPQPPQTPPAASNGFDPNSISL